jgi:hypothetical protein
MNPLGIEHRFGAVRAISAGPEIMKFQGSLNAVI